MVTTLFKQDNVSFGVLIFTITSIKIDVRNCVHMRVYAVIRERAIQTVCWGTSYPIGAVYVRIRAFMAQDRSFYVLTCQW